MKRLKQIMAIVMAVMMGVVFMPALPGVNGQADAATSGWQTFGTCEWQISEGTLSIRPENAGTSGMLPDDCTAENSWPWNDSRSSITTVVIEEGVKAGNSTAYMFSQCTALRSIDVSGFDTSDTKNMLCTFSNCESLESLDVTGFDTSNVTNMSNMFSYCDALKNLDVRGFDTSGVTDMSLMFNGPNALESLDVTGFDTSDVINMSCMFNECTALKSLDVTGFDTSDVKNMSAMFSNCNALESLDVTGFDTSGVTNMTSMFLGCRAMGSLDVAGFNTSGVMNMSRMFAYCTALKTIYASENFKTDNVTNSLEMFLNSSCLKGENGTQYDENHIDRNYARIDGGTENPGYFTNGSSVDLSVDLRDGRGNVFKSTESIEKAVERAEAKASYDKELVGWSENNDETDPTKIVQTEELVKGKNITLSGKMRQRAKR